VSAVLVLIAGALLAVAGWRVAIVAVLGVTAASFNVIVPIPSVEATTTVVLCAAIALGARTGAAAGLVAVVASSVAGGVGIWTMWQVVAVLAVALIAGAVGIAGRRVDWFSPRGVALLAAGAFVATLAWDVIVTTGGVLSFAPAPGATVADQLAAALLLGATFTATHVVFTAAFTCIGGPPLLHALVRARHRLDGGTVAT
jgi:uncharacterized membrane protein